MFASKDLDIRREIARKQNINFDDSPATLIYERKFMTLDTVLKASYHQPGIFPLQTVILKYPWVEYLFKPDSPTLSTMRCMRLI